MAASNLDQNAVVAKYKELQNECSQLVNKITELEFDRNEHRYVLSMNTTTCDLGKS